MFRYFVSVFVLTCIFVLYEKYNRKQEKGRHMDIVQMFLLEQNESPPDNSLPILWVHLDYQVNSRHWENFGSRNTKELNKPYLYLCLESLVHACKDDFNICFIDDRSLSRLLPEWNVSLHNVSNPAMLRNIGFMRLLYEYGGLICPSGFLALQNLNTIYEQTRDGVVFCETRNTSVLPSKTVPNHLFMASAKGDSTLKQMIEKLEKTIDFGTEAALFEGKITSLCLEYVKRGDAILIDGKCVGVIDAEDRVIPIEHLFNEDYINFDDSLIGIEIPSIERTKFGWFNRNSAQQIMHSNFILAKYFTLVKSNI